MKNGVIAGGVGIWLDEIVPCLKDTETGESFVHAMGGGRELCMDLPLTKNF